MSHDITPLPAPAPLRLWRVRASAMPPKEALDLLSRAELDRAAGMHRDRDRQRYLASHLALRRLIGQTLQCSPAALRFRTGRFGKPALETGFAPCAFSMSHSQDLSVIALCERSEIGVDVELARPLPDALSLAAAHFTAGEQETLQRLSGHACETAFLRIWTRKEACLKALGTGLQIAPNTFETGCGSQRQQVQIVVRGRSRTVCVESLEVIDGAALAIAWCADVAPQ
jgi:4'-phosphopantetheinyl transferase